MEEKLYLSLLELKKNIDSDERIIYLNECENRLNSSEEVMLLSYKKDMACLQFNDALKHFAKDSKEVNDAQAILYEAKTNLDLHPLVVEYKKAYKEAMKLYEKINETLFSPFNINKENKGNIYD